MRRWAYAVDPDEIQPGIRRPYRGSTLAAVTLTGRAESFDQLRATHAVRIVTRMIEAGLGTGVRQHGESPLNSHHY